MCPEHCTDVHPALPALRCTVTGTVQLYTAPTHVAWCSDVAGGDVFEFIINCMSLLNIAHARHCPHRSRWLPWPGARIIATKTPTTQVTPRAERAKLWHKIISLRWKFIWSGGCGGIFCVVGNIYLWRKHGTIRVTALTQTNLTKQKTRIDYPRQLCGRWWLGRLRIIKFAFLILKYLGSDHNKDSCEVPEYPEEYFPLQSTSSEKASLSSEKTIARKQISCIFETMM